MAALIPPAFVALAALLWKRRISRTGSLGGNREALLAGAILAGLLTTAIAELTGLARLFDRTVVACLWLAGALLLAGLAIRKRPAMDRDAGDRVKLEPFEAGLLLGLAALSVAVGVTAWAAAPNNWDSMTYHLPRALHWIQNSSVSHYPTHILRQLTLGPGGEFLVAELELLCGSDRFVLFIQMLAWLGCAAAASLIAKDLGAGRSGQVWAAIFAATLPMALLQASSTQNDLVLSFWLLAFVHFSFRVFRKEAGILDWLAIGGSLGLALLTKATAYLFAFPVAVALGIASLRARRARDRGGLALAVLVALLVNGGAWARNLALFHTPLGGEHGAVNTAFSPAILFSNLARNTTLQLASPWGGWNQGVEDAVLRLHALLGIDASDPRSTWRGAEFHVPARLSGVGPADSDEMFFAMFHEDQAANPLHLLLLVAAAVLAIARPALRSRRDLVWSFAALAGAFLLFSFILRWQPWGARLELPLLVFGAPLAGVVFASERGGPRAILIPALLLIASCPWVLSNATRPLLGPESVLTTPRFAQAFANRPVLAQPLVEACRFVAARGCRQIGLELGPDDPEYLVWLSLREAGALPERVEHVDVRNRSAALANRPRFRSFSPCVLIELSGPGARPSGGELFARDWPGGRIVVHLGPASN